MTVDCFSDFPDTHISCLSLSDFMTFDAYYGGSAVDILYSQTMNNNSFSESEWNPSHLVRLLKPYSSETLICRVDVYRNQVPLNPNDYETPYNPPRIPPPIEVSPLPGHVVSYPRPKSSPSTFGPNVEDLLFTENPFRIKPDGDYPPVFSMSPMPSSKAQSPYFGGEFPVSNPSVSPARQAPIPIAPDPVGLRQINALKRMREDEDYADSGPKRRKRAPSQVGPVELNEEEQLLLKLKEEENLPWKDIAVRFQTDLGKSYQVPALQMRFKRLRERMRTWTETDVRSHFFCCTL